MSVINYDQPYDSNNWFILEVSDCEIFTHHDASVVICHDCENYHDCHVMQTFSVNKQAI